MPTSKPYYAIIATTLYCSMTQTHAASTLEQVHIIGERSEISDIAGSAYVVDLEELQQFQYTDIHRMLASVPGVYLQQEDGYGLRPNIGIRGSGSERSAKVSLMEDGVLIAPAPYSNPEAYYFPTAARMQGIEVLKGPESLKHGPFTVGGAVNLISTAIPEQAQGQVELETGENNERRAHLYYGDSSEQLGWLVEAHRHQGDGYKDIDRSSRNAGFDKQDYMAKLRIALPEAGSTEQQLTLKLQYSEEVSNMSYVGLSDADLAKDAERRYGLTALDKMNNRHSGLTLSHQAVVNESLSFSTTAYYQQFNRDWYKVDKINGSDPAGLFAAANSGDTIAQAMLDGSVDITGGIDLKHNNREYRSKGVDSRLSWAFNTGDIAHDLSIGARLHRDQMDRFQPVDSFNQINGQLIYQSSKVPTGSNNRMEVGYARSLYLFDRIDVSDRLLVTAALRHENIKTQRDQYADAGRDSAPSHRQNHSEALLPGLGAIYQLDPQWSLLAGVHKGFAPAGGGANNGEDPEQSWNYELGLRHDSGSLRAEAIAFYSDYENTVRNCSVAVRCSDGRESGTESLGEAEIQGLEASIQYAVDLGNGLSLPLRASYTYTDAEITEDAFDGSTLAGDNKPYLPEQQWALSAALESSQGWRAALNARFNDQMCVDTRCDRGTRDNRLYQTDRYWVVDLSASYPIRSDLESYVKIDNLLDENAIASRSPYGARSEKPRSMLLGLRYQF